MTTTETAPKAQDASRKSRPGKSGSSKSGTGKSRPSKSGSSKSGAGNRPPRSRTVAVDDVDHEVATNDPASALKAKRLRITPTVSIGPIGHLAKERARLNSLTWENFEAVRYSATIGAELQGVDLTSDLSDEVVAEIRQALMDYKVIFFRNQPITPDQHVKFAKYFGDLEIHPFIPSNTEQPELVRFEKSSDVGGYENGWHSDVSWRETPSMGAVLHAIAVPETGGDTLFCDMYAAYEGLSDEMKERIDSMVAVHDYAKAFGHQLDPEAQKEMRKKFPMVEHPVVRTHADTGRKLLYVNHFFVSHIAGVSKEESDELMEVLCRQATTLEYQCRFNWEVDSVVFWDNRAVQHYASSDYWPDVRIMERASIIGERPF